jgi:carbamoyl-phosphate synthase large subunit
MKAFGLPVAQVVNKVRGVYPTCSDVIREGRVQAVLNTLSPDRTPLHDGLELRRAAVERRIPCFTSLDTARVAAEALVAAGGFNVRPLHEYLRGPKAEQAAVPGAAR